jgi:hypothetical protein
MGPRVRRLAADTIAWEYSTHSQEPPAARLRAALRAAHDQIRSELDGHVSVGASVIAVEHKDVYLAQVAPAQVYVLHEGSLHSISATVGGSSPFANALGSSRGPQVQLFRDQVEPGDMIALTASWFHQSADPTELRECFGAGSADDVAEALLDLAKAHDVRDASVIVVEVAEASQLEMEAGERPPGFMEQVDNAVQALANVGRLIMAELRPNGAATRGNGRSALVGGDDEFEPVGSAVPAAAMDEQATSEFPHLGATSTATEGEELIPERRAPGPETISGEHPYLDELEPDWNPDETETLALDELQAADEEYHRPPVREHATEEVPAVAPEESALPDESLEPLPQDEQEDVPEWQEPEGPPERREAEEPAPRSFSELDEVNSRLRRDEDLGDVIPPVQTFDEPSTIEPSRIYATGKDIERVNRRQRRFGGVAGREGGSTPVVRPPLGNLDLRRPMSRNAPPWAVWLAAAVFGVFVVFGAYEVLKHRHSGTATNPYPAKFVHNIALAKAATVPGQQDLYLSKASEDITLAQQAGATHAKIASMQSQLSATKDVIYKITREVPVQVAHFVQPVELALNPDAIYVLDSGKKGVFSVSPTSNSSPTEVVQAGEQDGGFTFDVPQHIATAGSTALAIDENNTLVRYSAGTKTATRLEPPTPTERNAGMANFGPDVYLLDSAGNQVWRYPDAVASDTSVPGGFFSPNTPNVGQLTAFTLDDKDMFLLKADGTILKFDTQQASPQPWQEHDPALRTGLSKPDAIFTDVGLNYVWVADPANARIIQFDKSGKYIRAYEAGPTSSMNFGQIKSIGVPSDGKTLYVLAGTQLFKFPVTP